MGEGEGRCQEQEWIPHGMIPSAATGVMRLLIPVSATVLGVPSHLVPHDTGILVVIQPPMTVTQATRTVGTVVKQALCTVTLGPPPCSIW